MGGAPKLRDLQVYSNYAASIVSLLDIHPEPWTQKHSSSGTQSPSLEILEAGTGHGSLTLHVARAIASANPPPLNAMVPQVRPSDPERKERPEQAETQNILMETWTEWKQTRRAVLHTVEKVTTNRYHAEKIVRGFRQGIYWPHVDFYAGDISAWIEGQMAGRRGRSWNPLSNSQDEFLDYVLLDMPGVHNQLKHVHAAMRSGARLVVFAPSVTQIGDCARVIQEGSLPLTMEKVLELGEGISSGRRWDVKMVMPRRPKSEAVGSTQTPAVDSEPNDQSTPKPEEIEDSANIGEALPDALPPAYPEEQPEEPVMVCRPLVGERTLGGGFIALFSKKSPDTIALAAEWRRGQTGTSVSCLVNSRAPPR